MSIISRGDFCIKYELKSKDLSIYAKRGQLIIEGGFIDMSVATNINFVRKRNCKLVGVEFIPVEDELRVYANRLEEVIRAGMFQLKDENIISFSEFKTRYRVGEYKLQSMLRDGVLFSTCNTINLYDPRNKEVADWLLLRKTEGFSIHRYRISTDPMYRFKCSVRRLITYSFKNKGYKKGGRTERILGCTHSEFAAHIESLFLPGMSFANRSLWHIDHRIPLATAKSIDDVIRLCHYTNLQPLWAVDNLKKGSKYDGALI